MAAIISLSARDAVRVLEAWRAEQSLLRQDPAWRDPCYSCGEENSPDGPEGPSLREGWECYWCHAA